MGGQAQCCRRLLTGGEPFQYLQMLRQLSQLTRLDQIGPPNYRARGIGVGWRTSRKKGRRKWRKRPPRKLRRKLKRTKRRRRKRRECTAVERVLLVAVPCPYPCQVWVSVGEEATVVQAICRGRSHSKILRRQSRRERRSIVVLQALPQRRAALRQ